MFRNPLLRTSMLAIASVTVFTLFAGGDQIVRAVSQNPQNPQTPQQDPEQTGRRGGRGGQATPPAPRPYAQVITAAAKTDDGIVKVHRVGETLYYEIPKAQLGKDFLWNTQIKKTTIGAGYGGQAAGSRVVRWVTKGDRVLLLSIDYSLVADQVEPHLPGDRRRQLSDDHPGVQRRGLQPVGRSRDRRDAALPDRRSGDLGARPDRRPRLRPHPFVRRAGGVVPRERQRRGDADLHRQ